MSITTDDPLPDLRCTPIGIIRTPFAERVDAPRQAVVAADTEGTIELTPGRDFEHALEDLEGWDRIWVVYWFHRNDNWRPKVLPPRSEGRRRGLFSTRSPHRPNPIGISAVSLVSVTGLTVRVRGVDMVDRTPVLDLKPYVPYADAFPDSRTGWLSAEDPRAEYDVVMSPVATAQLDLLREHGVHLSHAIERVLALGPQPNAYRRIRREDDGLRLAIKDWRVAFTAEGRVITVQRLHSGYRPSQIYADDAPPELLVHRVFQDRYP